MEYQTWLNIINDLKKGNLNQEKLQKLQEAPINNNINDLLVPKLEELIKTRFEKIIYNITNELGNIFSDYNYLDLILVNLKKDLTYLLAIASLKQIPKEKQEQLKDYLKDKSQQIYDILLNEARNIDYTGMYEITINNNKMKWSE
ncbi:MAG TPA: hypothetical protein IAC02_04155 [Candidatus Coprovivens excrementavium]|nr:hypothetical protein [Candidatus Coprovivens excrementavium]